MTLRKAHEHTIELSCAIVCFPEVQILYGLNLQTSRHLAVKRGNKQNKSIQLLCFNKRRILGGKYFSQSWVLLCSSQAWTRQLVPRPLTCSLVVRTPDTLYEFTRAIMVAPELCSANLTTFKATTLLLDHVMNRRTLLCRWHSRQLERTETATNVDIVVSCGPPPGGELPGKLGGGVRPASQNPYPIYDQNLRYSLPY